MSAYRPANGTDGMDFVARWCANCACDEVANGRDEDGKTCPILNNSFALPETHVDYPPELIEDDKGCRCTAFVEHTGQGWVDPHQAARARAAYDALPRDPATGRPVI